MKDYAFYNVVNDIFFIQMWYCNSSCWYIIIMIVEPETVMGLLDNSSSTSHLHLTILPPSFSFFNLYNVEVFRENGSELIFDQNISLSRDETDIFLWNLTAGTLYNFSVTTRTIWEESDIYSTEFVTCKDFFSAVSNILIMLNKIWVFFRFWGWK